jgi:hypothetical protein
MFAIKESLYLPSSKKKSPSLISWLCFNARQSPHYDVGHFGEKLAIALFEDAGYKAWKTKERHCGDLAVTDLSTGFHYSVEVKTSAFSEASKKWQFCINKENHTCSSSAAFLLLICVAKTGVFAYLLPCAFLGKMKQLSIYARPESYRGKIAPFYCRNSLSFENSNEIYALMN